MYAVTSKRLQHWRTLSTVKDHLYHSLASKFWHWLTQTNLRLLAFRLGPLIPPRIGVRIYKTYSVWQLLLQLLRKAKQMSEQQRFTAQWPEGVCKSLHVECVSLSFSGQLWLHLPSEKPGQPISVVKKKSYHRKILLVSIFSHVQEEGTACQQASFNCLVTLPFSTVPPHSVLTAVVFWILLCFIRFPSAE